MKACLFPYHNTKVLYHYFHPNLQLIFQIRASSKISDAPFILIVDCDMCSNSSESIRDAMCFFMDEDSGYKFSFVQFPQNFRNLHKSNTYGDYIPIVNEVSINRFILNSRYNFYCSRRQLL